MTFESKMYKLVMSLIAIVFILSIQYTASLEQTATIGTLDNIPQVSWVSGNETHIIEILNSNFLDGITYDSQIIDSKIISKKRIGYTSCKLIIGKKDIPVLLNSTFDIRRY